MNAHAGFLPYHALVTAPSAAPARWMLVLHGIFGSGANWRTFVRRLAEAQAQGGAPGAAARPWGFLLVDLRAHGLSQSPPPPHTVAAAAEDLLRLGDHLGLDVRGVMGHSFGGKVALAYLERRREGIERGFLLDADPSAKTASESGTESAAVLELLRAMPQPIASREAFLDAVQAAGFGRGIAEWLAMNVRRSDDGFRIRLDLDAMADLLSDYFARDLWHALEDPPAGAAAGERRIHVVLGGRSTAIPPASRGRFEALAARAPWLSVHVLPGAGHWLHVDDPDGLFDVIRASL
ncbi:alpha/beta hydrolase [Sorangium cellulosum]|uniref:Alpha/beta hydrolase n=1 Tax=Sorangium cellulosum TaxID=56 RepID=A0A4P2QBG2_SORCE|nr:alpha/beta fold hydrolase [Sorangium cellulosum]AUX26939.1 alpha/beta hydrolase [Sorangium cellulosum]